MSKIKNVVENIKKNIELFNIDEETKKLIFMKKGRLMII